MKYFWRRRAFASCCAVVAVVACAPQGLIDGIGKSLGLTFEPPSIVPNGTVGGATPITGTQEIVKGNVWPNGDVDFYSFSATAGDRVYLALYTAGSAGSSTDSQLTLLDTDGSNVIEFDDDNGQFAGLSSAIAGATLPATGTYFIKVNDQTPGTTSERGYDLYFRLQAGTPAPEVEPNDSPGTATPLPASGWVSGARNPATASEQDWYAMTLAAGDTVFLSLDLDPEDDLVVWNGRLGFGLFGDATNQILVGDDSGTGDVGPAPNRPSEAFFATVKEAGTYYVFVDSATAAVGGPTATYHLSVTVYPAVPKGINCTTYTSSDVPVTIGPGTGLASSTITIPGHPRIADINVGITLNHALMADIDAHLRSPAGNDNGLFTDIGATFTGGQAQLDVVFDDEAAIAPPFTVLRPLRLRPENNSTAGTASTSGAYRLRLFEGEDAGGTWTLDLRDDTANASGGTLTGWFIEICEPAPRVSCDLGAPIELVADGDFEAGDAGFTHSGTADEWELGLPATVATTTTNPIAAFDSCHSGVSCWKTDLDDTYDVNSNQELVSPAISLVSSDPPYYVSWAMRHQLETASFDRFFVDVQEVGGANPQRLFEWLDPTPISASAGTGNPQVNIGGSAGWGVHTVRIDDAFAGKNVELVFHVDSSNAVQFGGVAIDDVSLTGCPQCGNGTLDPGEECDLGAANGEATSCCEVTCAFKAVDTVCRAAAGVCDAVEACTGEDGACPADLPTANGAPCDADGDPCTVTDSCQAGVCTAGTAVICPPPAACKLAGVCQPTSGECAYADAPNGAPCTDNDACTQTDVCSAGACVGGNVVTCLALDQCHDVGICNPSTGTCSNPAKADGTPCDDADTCTGGDGCQAGLCLGTSDGSCDPGQPPTRGGGCSAGVPPELGSLSVALMWLLRRRRARWSPR